jgi:hypothetical protein
MFWSVELRTDNDYFSTLVYYFQKEEDANSLDTYITERYDSVCRHKKDCYRCDDNEADFSNIDEATLEDLVKNYGHIHSDYYVWGIRGHEYQDELARKKICLNCECETNFCGSCGHKIE